VTVELKPEAERLVQEEIQRGRFHSVDEVIAQALCALREKSTAEPAPPRRPRKNFAQFLLDSPLPGSGLTLKRQEDYPRSVEL
jgi:Arc/MetJ-type ribon-helix-helix transcriptional regulator